MEFLGAIKIMRSQNIFFDVPPDPLNQIQVGRIGRQEHEVYAERLGQFLDIVAVLVAGIVQH